ncbi:MAG: hypothetical protein GEU77_06160 [Deltaproteobacteria bacterium]|nr:hypothetical protein [Deltaproteobacteria bacterium]
MKMTANFTLFMVAAFAGATYWGWHWPYIAKLMPVYVVAIPGLILSLVQLYRDATGWEKRQENTAEGIEMDETHNIKLDAKTELRRTLLFFAWFIGGAITIWLIGIVYSLPILVFLYALVDGRENLRTSLIMGVCTYGIIWGLFEYTLETRWPPGILIGY